MSTLIVRLSSLGDVVLAGHLTAQLAPVTFLTSRRYTEIALAFPGVQQVLAWEDQPDIRSMGFGRVIDLHTSPRSRWLTRGMGARRVERHDIQRRLRVALKRPPAPSVLERYSRAADLTTSELPWMPQKGPRDTLLLIPGAAHMTKRWAPERYGEIRQRWIAGGGKVLVLGSESERALCEEVASSEAEVLAEDGFAQTLEQIGRGVAALGSDTGLMHLAAAHGVPTYTLFGPTTADDGFWPHVTHALCVPLSCRPCSRHGGAHCPMQDHLCMQDLTADTVWDALSKALHT